MLSMYRLLNPDARHPSKGPAIGHAEGDYLRKAASKGDVHWAEACVKSGIDADPKAAAAMSALQIALAEGHTDVATMLLASGANANRAAGGSTPLMEAAAQGSLEAVQLLLANKAEVAAYVDGTTAVHMASKHGHMGILKLLLDTPGAAPDMAASPNAEGKTPLAMACTQAFGNEGVVALLVERGAPVDAVDKRGMTPLHTAAMVGNLGVARALVEAHGAAPLARVADARGRTPAHLAAGYGRVDVACYLAQHSDLECKDADGCTPLHLTAKCLMCNQAGQRRMAQAMLDAGADVGAKDKCGCIAADYAASAALKELLAAPASEAAPVRPTAPAPEAEATLEAVASAAELPKPAAESAPTNDGVYASADETSTEEVLPLPSLVSTKSLKVMSEALVAASADSASALVLKEALRHHSSEAGAATQDDNWRLSTAPMASL